ncbi:MAG: D-alanyl-D-alanine carboxypeptidase family protein [Actinomycetota bacterium]
MRLVAPAARAWTAMVVAAALDGHFLKVGYETSAYRPYADQERIFRARYVPHLLPARGRKYWNRRWWAKKHGVAAAAVPGTSNHGLGLAVDIGEESDGDPGTESIDAVTVAWLTGNAHRFGFSGELDSEPWHWRYFAGDAIPIAVLAFESNQEETMILLYDERTRQHRVAVPGEGSAIIDEPDHWREVIAAGRATGEYRSRHMGTLIQKIRRERVANGG